MKRIVLLGTAHPYRGGIAAMNERLAQEFIKEGHELTIYNFSLQYPSFLFPGKSQFSESPAPAGLRILRKINSLNPFNWWRTGREIARLKPDILIVRFWIPFMGPCLGTICRLVRRNRHTRIVSILDNVIPHESRPGDKLLTRYFIRSVHSYITLSAQVMQELSQFTDSQSCAVIPHPVYDHYGENIDRETALHALGLDPSYRYLLFFGFIRHYKGLDLLLKAMAEPVLENAAVRLIVAGEYYEEEAPYLELINRLGIKESVILRTDFIPDQEVKTFFSAADLIVQPYRSATQSGISQIAYHFEKPMIVTNVGGLPEMVPHGVAGYVVDQTPAAIAAAISDFFSSPGKATQLSEGLKREKEKYSWQALTSAILRLADASLKFH